MQFCPKCKGLLMPTKDGLMCMSCGYKEAGKAVEVKETLQTKKRATTQTEEIAETMPVMKQECPKCGNKEAYFYTQQTRAGDEAETQFFICTKCRHRWRVY